MTTAIPRNAYRTCPVCAHYWTLRADALAAPIAFRAFLRGVSVEVVAHEYMTGVHARHLAGGSLSTRPCTPDYVDENGTTHLRVRRCCNGCGETLGNVTESELDAAVAGEQLPDVRLECGCWSAAA